jgi:ornithine cyclodeaminase/alanine dehydrogenase-like protein (mu-crystallin family)
LIILDLEEAMKPEGTLLLTRSEVAALFSIEERIAAVEEVFRLQGKTAPPGVLGIKARDGDFHIKAGLLDLSKPYFVTKANANFPENMKRFGLRCYSKATIFKDDGHTALLMSLVTRTTTLRRRKESCRIQPSNCCATSWQ